MGKGVPLDVLAIDEIPSDAVHQFQEIYSTLKKHDLAHCDIKGGNIVLIEGKFKLIDADNLTKFGEPRTICSQGHNISKRDYEIFRNQVKLYCNEYTD